MLYFTRGDYITKKTAKSGKIPVILGGQEPAYYIDKANHYGKAIVISFVFMQTLDRFNNLVSPKLAPEQASESRKKAAGGYPPDR